MRLPRIVPPLIALLPALLAAGCARIDRVLLLDSDPAGARLYVDGAYVGPTPQRIPYVHPGRVAVRLEKEGYESVAAEVVIETTMDARIGLDFFAENVLPGGVHTLASHRFALTPLTPVSYTDAQLHDLLRRASEFREAARGEPAATAPATNARPAASATPPTPAPPAVGGLPPPRHVAGSAPPPPPPPPASPQGPPSPSR